MSERYSDLFMVDPVLVDDQFDYSGELSPESRQKIKYTLEETLGQMGISSEDVLFCPREAEVVDSYVDSMETTLQALAEDFVSKQSAGVYEQDSDEKDKDWTLVEQLKTAIKDPKPSWEFTGIDSIVNYSGADNPADEGAFFGSFGVYDAVQLRDRLDDFGTISASADEVKRAKLFNFYPRYMEKTDVATWVFQRVFKAALIHQEEVLEEPMPADSSGAQVMEWVGRKAQAHGKVTSEIELLEELGKYGIKVPLN